MVRRLHYRRDNIDAVQYKFNANGSASRSRCFELNWNMQINCWRDEIEWPSKKKKTEKFRQEDGFSSFNDACRPKAHLKSNENNNGWRHTAEHLTEIKNANNNYYGYVVWKHFRLVTVTA